MDDKKIDETGTQEKKLQTGGLGKDDIIEILNHDSFVKAIDKFSTQNKWVQVFKALAFALTAGLAIGGFYLAWDSNAEANKASENRLYEQQQIRDIESRINYKLQWWKEVTNSIMDMRKTRMQIVLLCKYKKPPSNYEQALMRFNARDGVARAVTGTDRIFSNAVIEKAHALTDFDQSVLDVCAKNSPDDSKWQEYLHEIDNIIANSIEDDQAALARLKSKTAPNK